MRNAMRLKIKTIVKAYAILALVSIGLSTSHADSKTSRLGLTIPDVGSPQWGTKVNNNFQILDSTVNINGGGGGGSATPGGSTSQVQFNNSGTFAGAGGLTYNTAFGVAASTVSIGPALFPSSPAQLVTTSTGTTEAARFQCNGIAGSTLGSADGGCINLTLKSLSDGFVVSAASITDNQSGAYMGHFISGPNWNDPALLIEKQSSGSNANLQLRGASQAGVEYIDTTLSQNLSLPAGKYKTGTNASADALTVYGRQSNNTAYQPLMDFYREGSANSFTASGDANVVLHSTAALCWTNYVANGGGTHVFCLRPNPAGITSSSFIVTLPGGYGTNGQAITTDGAGNLGYSTISGSSSTPVVVQSSGVAFGSSTSTVTSDASSLAYLSGTKSIVINHAASGGSYLIGNDNNGGSNIDYLLEYDNGGVGSALGYVGGTNTSSVGGTTGIAVYDGSKNEVARFGSIGGGRVMEVGGTNVGISTMNVLGNMTIGQTYAGVHATFNTGYAAPVSGLLVEGQVVVGTTVPANSNMVTVQGGVYASSFTASGAGTGSLSLLEGSQATVPVATAGTDVFWGDSTKTWPMFNANGGISSYTVVGTSVTVTPGHLAIWGSNSLSVIDGGTPGSGTVPGGNPYDVQVDSNGILGGYDNFQNNGTTVTLSSINAETQNNVVSVTASTVTFNYSTSSMTLNNLGIGTASTAFGKFQISSGVVLIDGTNSSLTVASSGQSFDLAISSQSGGPYALAVSSTGHINSEQVGGSTVTSCGTGPSIAVGSNDFHGTITVGTGSPSACTLTFAKTYKTNAPDCVVSDNSTTVVSSISSVTTSQLAISLSLGFSGKITYVCVGSD